MKYFDCTKMSVKQIIETWENLCKREKRCLSDIALNMDNEYTQKSLDFYRRAKNEINQYVLEKYNMEMP